MAIAFMMARGLRICRLLAICSFLAAGGGSSASARPGTPVDETIAFELFRMESDAVPLPPELEGRLRAVLNEAYASLGNSPRPPATAGEFTAFAERVSISLARHNFIQPAQEADWPDSIGEALRPVTASHPRLADYLHHPQNATRRRHGDASRPYYFLDCDMGALLLMSVAEMVGFDLSLVEIPKHNFVRWHDGRGNQANWDWTHWASLPDGAYGVSNIQILRNAHLRSLDRRESRGYFIGQLTINVSDAAARLRLARRAIADAPSSPRTANNVAWDYATIAEGVTPEERRAGLVYGLSALAAEPDNLNIMDTVACAYAATGNSMVGAAIEDHVARSAAGSAAEGYRRNLERIRRGELCQ